MLLRKLFRTAWSYKSQFISMVIMIAIGFGIFLGFNIEWKSLEQGAFTFLEDTNYGNQNFLFKLPCALLQTRNEGKYKRSHAVFGTENDISSSHHGGSPRNREQKGKEKIGERK